MCDSWVLPDVIGYLATYGAYRKVRVGSERRKTWGPRGGPFDPFQYFADFSESQAAVSHLKTKLPGVLRVESHTSVALLRYPTYKSGWDEQKVNEFGIDDKCICIRHAIMDMLHGSVATPIIFAILKITSIYRWWKWQHFQSWHCHRLP